MGYDHASWRCRHREQHTDNSITGKNGTRVVRFGCNLEAAMHPVEPERPDPSGGLMAELEAQRRAHLKT